MLSPSSESVSDFWMDLLEGYNRLCSRDYGCLFCSCIKEDEEKRDCTLYRYLLKGKIQRVSRNSSYVGFRIYTNFTRCSVNFFFKNLYHIWIIIETQCSQSLYFKGENGESKWSWEIKVFISLVILSSSSFLLIHSPFLLNLHI